MMKIFVILLGLAAAMAVAEVSTALDRDSRACKQNNETCVPVVRPKPLPPSPPAPGKPRPNFVTIIIDDLGHDE